MKINMKRLLKRVVDGEMRKSILTEEIRFVKVIALWLTPNNNVALKDK